MIPLGKTISLKINRFTKHGAYLMNSAGEEVLLPQKYLDSSWKVNDDIETFVIKDSEDRRVALIHPPLLSLNEFAVLKIVEINAKGAFADWGIDRDLFIPFSEQINEIEMGKSYAICLKYDDLTDRLYGTMKTNKNLISASDNILGLNLPFLVTEKLSNGWRGIVDQKYPGMIYFNECPTSLTIGDVLSANVFTVRKDGKIDLKLSAVGFKKYDDATEQIWELLQKDKFLYLHDKSTSEEIYKALKMSKRTFKQAIGKLYKEKKIALFKDKIARIDE